MIRCDLDANKLPLVDVLRMVGTRVEAGDQVKDITVTQVRDGDSSHQGWASRLLRGVRCFTASVYRANRIFWCLKWKQLKKRRSQDPL